MTGTGQPMPPTRLQWARFDDQTDVLAVHVPTVGGGWEITDKVLGDRDAGPVLRDDAEAFLMRRHGLTAATCEIIDRPTAPRRRRRRTQTRRRP